MSKLSAPLKALINAAHARPSTCPAPPRIASVYEAVAKDAQRHKVGLPAWLCASAAATVTMNSPDSLLELYELAASPAYQTVEHQKVYAAELIREVGLKCIGLNGVPRTINTLGAFYNGLPSDVQEKLRERPPRRNLTADNIPTTVDRAHKLWDSIYHPLTSKLTAKLAQSHPDLPVFIIEGEYGALFSDPAAAAHPQRPNIGRVLMSVLAIVALRAQTGVGPQVLSHVFGLRKAFEDGTAEGEEVVPGGRWLASDDGSIWLLEQVDKIVAAISEGKGTTFAAGMGEPVKAKL